MQEKLKPPVMPLMAPVIFFKNNSVGLKLPRDYLSQKNPLGKSLISTDRARKQREGHSFNKPYQRHSQSSG